MEALLIYLAKSSAILALFLGVYQFLLKRETFFAANRLFLLGGLAASLLLPLVTFTRTVRVSLEQTAVSAPSSITGATAAAETAFPWADLLVGAYALGVLTCLVLILRQLWSVYRLIAEAGTPVRSNGFRYVPTPATQAPFSFFRYIFYNPHAHAESELGLILEHERAHGYQCHTLDILLARIGAAILWPIPISWWYRRSIEQNLEYLADAHAVRHIPSVREYQYTLLKVSGNAPVPGLVNAFYSSLIKKRILMLHQNESRTIHGLKYAVILPVLGLFLMAFHTETRYVFEETLPPMEMPAADKTVELTISKDSSEEELQEMKADLSRDGIDFSYTAVRNDSGEIIDLEVQLRGTNSEGKSFSGSYHTETDSPIEPVLIRFDDSSNSLSFGSASSGRSSDSNTFTITHSGDSEDTVSKHVIVRTHIETDEDGNTMYWNSEGDDDVEVIEIREVDDKKIIIRNGEEIDEETLEKLSEGTDKKHKVKIRKLTQSEEGSNVMILRDSDDEADIEVIREGGKGGFFFIDSGKGEKPLFYIDGKKASRADIEKLDPSAIDKVEVIRGDKATSEYGKKAKDGVVKITTKE